MYKHSLHLIAKNIVLDTFTTGAWLCEQIDDELTRKGREDNCIDKGIYSSNRSFRVYGSKKEARGMPLRSDIEIAFADTLITCYDCPDGLTVVQPRLPPGSRKRSASVSRDSTKKMRLDSPIAEKVQYFLDASPIARGLLWTGARVREVFQGSGQDAYIYLKVGFEDKGTRHMCAAGEWHNGNCSQTWRIRVNPARGETMESSCWPTGNFARKCANPAGRAPWFHILHPDKTPVRLSES